MDSSAPVDRLLTQVSEVLRDLPGAERLYLFGSCADPALKDAYSDLDLEVLCSDLQASQAAFPWILSRVSPIRLAFSLSENPKECACSVSLAGESLYHKIDIGLYARQDPNALIHRVSRKILIWEQPAPAGDLPAISQAGCQPAPGSLEFFLVGELLSAVRYIKARKRGQHLTCWRFLSRKFNAWLGCRLSKQGAVPAAALTTWDYAALDRQLPETERLEMLAILREQTSPEMDRSLMEITLRIVQEMVPRFKDQDPILDQLIAEYLDFIKAELRLV